MAVKEPPVVVSPDWEVWDSEGLERIDDKERMLLKRPELLVPPVDAELFFWPFFDTDFFDLLRVFEGRSAGWASERVLFILVGDRKVFSLRNESVEPFTLSCPIGVGAKL